MEALRDFVIGLSIVALAVLFQLPSWHEVKPSVEITSARVEDNWLKASISYSAPFPGACYLVVYGPFAFAPGISEEGNNIIVLDKQKGSLNLNLPLKGNLTELKVELWCDNTKLASATTPL